MGASPSAWNYNRIKSYKIAHTHKKIVIKWKKMQKKKVLFMLEWHFHSAQSVFWLFVRFWSVYKLELVHICCPFSCRFSPTDACYTCGTKLWESSHMIQYLSNWIVLARLTLLLLTAGCEGLLLFNPSCWNDIHMLMHRIYAELWHICVLPIWSQTFLPPELSSSLI